MPIRIALCQVRDVDESMAAFARQLGVTSVNITTPPLPDEQGYWEVDDLVALRRRCNSLGLTLEVIENTAYHMYDKIMLGGVGRDQQLENYQRTIRNVAAAGIPVLGYHFMATGVWRTSMDAPGRGGCAATAFNLSDVPRVGNQVKWWPENTGRPLHLSAEELWENYRVFLDAVLPVAEEAGIRLAQHPDDPPVEEIDGVARLFTSPENFIRAEQIAAGSPAWGLDLCLGTTSEMHGGADAVRSMIRHFGPRGRIFYVHFRDVQGTVPQFQECFLGEGNYDPPSVIRELIDVGFDGWLQDDHVPVVVDDTRYGHRARAHAIGYMQGLLASVAR